MNARRKLVLAGAAGAALALLAFLLLDRWVFRPGPAAPFWAAHQADRKLAEAAYEEAAESIAKMDCDSLANLAETFLLTHGRNPDPVHELASPQPDGKPALCAPERLADPWGRPYRLEVKAGKARFFTTAPSGRRVEGRAWGGF